MPNVFKKAFQLLVGDDRATFSLVMPKNRPLKKLTERELLQAESEIGAQLFGEVPKGHQRQFFCLDATTWIWYEEWQDPKTYRRQSTTVRYEVHDNGVLKVQEGARYSYIEGVELKNLAAATTLYYERVAREVYKRDPHTGQKLAQPMA